MPTNFELVAAGKAQPKKNEKKKKPYIPVNPITTQGKILRVKILKEKAKKNQPREAPASSAATMHKGSDPETAFAKPKPRPLSPPVEMEELHRREEAQAAAAARKIYVTDGKWDVNRYKPITTQQKIAAVKASKPQTVMGGTGGAAYGGAGNVSGREAMGSKLSRSMAPGVFTQLRNQKPTMGHPIGNKEPKDKTARFSESFESEKVKQVRDVWRKKQANQNARIDISKSVAELRKEWEEKSKEPEPFQFLNLSEEIRQRIIRYAVVDTKHLMWPETKEGRQQPDLSMVCKEVRADVLPIYYAENTFGISVAPTQDRAAPKVPQARFSRATGDVITPKLPLTGLNAVCEWARVMSDRRNERGKWLDMITKWAFSYEDPEAGVITRRAARANDSDGEERSFVVSVKFPEGAARRGRAESVRSPDVTVHRVAACILPGSDEYEQCVVQRVPWRLNDMVIGVVERDGSAASQAADLARAMRGTVDEVCESACEKAVHRIARRRAT